MVLQTLVNPSMSQAGTKTVQQFSKNGFTYLLGEDHSLPNIALGISLDTGAILDPIGKEGLTQITMDMLMRGTKTRSRDQINEQIEFLGATLSPNSGFTTSGVEGETLTRYIDTYMEMLGDVLLNPAFSEKELQLQKRETLDMLKLSLNNDTVLGRKNFNRLVFGDSPYGRPVDGTQASLEAITLADVQERYQSLFRKGAMTIYAAGDIDKDQLIALFEKYLPNIPDGGSKIKRLPKPTPLKQRHLVIVDKPDRTQVQIFMGHPNNS
jgi:zinc protease